MRLTIVCRCVECALVLLLIVALGAQWDRGLADNGDFSRIMTWFVSKPVGFETNWPPAGTAEWQRRFFAYYLPAWQFDFPPGTRPVYSSVLLLWLPGIALNYLLYPSTLHLALMSLLPRLLLIGCLILLLAWIGRRCATAGERLSVLLTLGLPAALFLAAPDYVAYLNSFYQETGAFVFLLLLLGALVALRARPAGPRSAATALILLALLTTSKASEFYWAFIGLPLILAPLLRRRARATRAAACLGGAIVLAALSLYLTGGANDRRNAFHGLFDGVLTLSTVPGERLAELGFGDGAECVGTPAYVGPGPACVARYGDRGLRLKTVRVLLREPAIIPKIPALAAERMQITQPEGLGNRAADSRGPNRWPAIIVAWSALKARAFPRGPALFVALAAYAALCLSRQRRGGLTGDLAFVGIIAAIGCLAAMIVAVLGDGRQELVKHLFVANVAFDVATLAALNVAIAELFALRRRAIGRAGVALPATLRGDTSIMGRR